MTSCERHIASTSDSFSCGTRRIPVSAVRPLWFRAALARTDALRRETGAFARLESAKGRETRAAREDAGMMSGAGVSY
eukprot:31229-Pelagococcus_subviridis.AAC.14